MSNIKIAGFGGMVPKLSPALIPANQAQSALNCKLMSGELRGWKKPARLETAVTLAYEPTTIFRSRDASQDDLWFAWDKDVDVCRSPVFDTTEWRVYYTGDGAPKHTNSSLGGTSPGPDDWYYLGTPRPAKYSTPPAVSGTAAGTVETRYYVYTYVQTFGSVEEEGPPCAITVSDKVDVTLGATGTAMQTVTLSGFAAPSTDHRNITKLRIYRSSTGFASTAFLRVADVTVSAATNYATLSYTDNVAPTLLGEPCPSDNYDEPPTDLKGLVLMPGNFYAGFRGNEVCFSEPNIPHAWPIEYRQTVEFQIVGIAVVGQSLCVMTQGHPYILTGTDPAGMTNEKVPIFEPCVAKRSITSDISGVLYASPNGLVTIGPAGANIFTMGYFTRDEWQEYNPPTMVSAVYEGRYFVFYNRIDGLRGCIILDRRNESAAVTLASLVANAVYVDTANGQLYVAEGKEIKKWDSDPVNAVNYLWRSKLFVLPAANNFKAMRVEADFDSIAVAERIQAEQEAIYDANQALFATTANLLGGLNDDLLNQREVNGCILQSTFIVDDRYVNVKMYIDGTLKHQRFVTNNKMKLLPSGFVGDHIEIEVDGNIPLRQIVIGDSVAEVARASTL